MDIEIIYDEQARAFYIDLNHSKKYRHTKELTGNVGIDYDIDGGVQGIEFLHVDKISLGKYVYSDDDDLSGPNREPIVEIVAELNKKKA